jgi:hypothetical protein
VGRDLTIREVTIQQYFGAEPRPDSASRNRRAMIEKVWAIWITGVLQPSLPHDILLDLGLTERPVMVTRMLDLYAQRPDLADQGLPPGTQLIDVFDRLDRALLILGAPGAGKTTLLLTLARDLLIRAAQDPEQPIPVVFPLSSWAEQRCPLADWLMEALSEQYQVPRTTGRSWVETDQILPLLDGLDEVKVEARAACVEAINTFRQEHGLLPLVVCSRVVDYEVVRTRLRLQGAVVVQSLTREQVDSYLAQVGHPLAAVREVLHADPTLWELLDTPLMLYVVTLAYASTPVEALRTQEASEARRQHLFSAYVDQMFRRRGSRNRYTRVQTERWLAWLAWQMTRHSQIVFYLERLQPDWLPAGRRWLPTQGARVLAGLVGGLFVGPLVWLHSGLTFGLSVGFIAALIGGLTAYSQEITPIETVHWSWSKFCSELFLLSRHSLRRGLRTGLLGGLGFGVICGLFPWWSGLAVGIRVDVGVVIGVILGVGSWPGFVLGFGLSAGLGFGLGVGLSVWLSLGPGSEQFHELVGELVAKLHPNFLLEGLVSGLLSGLRTGLIAGPAYKLSTGLSAGLSGGEITTKAAPNEGIHRSARMAVSCGLGLGMAAGLVGWLVGGLNTGGVSVLSGGVFYGLLTGLLVGLATIIRYGGRACLQHLVLRLSLEYDDCTPRRYVDFLDYAAERLFLRRVGGGYIFIHRLLQEYFAARYSESGGDRGSVAS